MNRKAQYYLLVSLLLIVFLFAAIASNSITPKPSSNFRQLYESFMTESPKVINSGIYDRNLTERFHNFSSSFILYSKSKSPNFGYTYALLDQNQLEIANHLAEQINATTDYASFIINPGSRIVSNRTQNLTIKLGSTLYMFSFTKQTEIKAIFKQSSRNEVLIHVED